MARRRKPYRYGNARSSGSGQGKKALGRLLGDWLRLTFTDSTTLPRTSLRLGVVNLVIAACFGAWFYTQGLSKPAVIMIGVWLLITLGRSAMIMPKRRRVLTDLYQSTYRSLGHPAHSAIRPAPINDVFKVRSWDGARIKRILITVGDCPATASDMTHSAVERPLSNALPPAAAGTVWVFTWTTPTSIDAQTTPVDSPAALQQKFKNTAATTLLSIMGIKGRGAEDCSADYNGWETVTDKNGKHWQFPSSIMVTTGGFDSSSPTLRDQFMRSFDNRMKTPGEWVYTWGPADVEISRVPADSTAARRKKTERKISDDVQSSLRGGAKDIAVVTIEEWSEEDNRDDHPIDISIDFGTRNIADRRARDAFERVLDTSLEATFPESVWLYDWQPAARTVVNMTAVGSKSDAALRKRAEARLRNVVESKFGSSRNFVDCDILEWSDKLSDRGEAIPEKARVAFGDFDVTKRETQESFESHWDSLSTDRDWHYNWATAEGEVIITAVQPLPDAVAFPNTGKRAENIRLAARTGTYFLGPQKGGGFREWNLNEVPHALVGGKTGSGKSVALNIVLFLSLWWPQDINVIVCDPKRTDFTWTPEFPGVIKFGATDEELVSAVAFAKQSMDQRQTLLNKTGVRNLAQLRALYKDKPELEKKWGPVPPRLILFFDEIADFLAKSANKDIEELKNEARANLETIGRLGRALEVNIVSAAQKPDAKIVSTQLRSQLGFRLGVGPLDQYESEQILNSNHGTRFPEEGTPKGRSWAYDSKRGYRQIQVPFLPDDTSPAPWDPSITLPGMKDMLRERMAELGYHRITVQNADGGDDPRWVRVDEQHADTPPTGDGSDEIEEASDEPTLDSTTSNAPPMEWHITPRARRTVPDRGGDSNPDDNIW